MDAIISFKDFSFKYRSLNEKTLKNISLTINRGERVLIAGPSGSGKSTLAHCINGLIPFSYDGEFTGELLVNGVNPARSTLFDISKTVGTILQDQDAQFVGLSVGEDVAFTLENNMVAKESMDVKVEDSLKAVDMLDYVDASPHELSGGQKQRVSLAGILCSETDVLLFDEPLANLDPASGRRTMELISKLHKEFNKTVIIIEHRIEEVLSQEFDKVVIVDNGEIKAIGTPHEILKKDVLKKSGLREPLYIEAMKLAGCNLANDDLSRFEGIKIEEYKEALLKWYSASKVQETTLERKKVLELKDIKFSYEKNKQIIKGVSLELHKGELVSLLGNNGAGKSTLLKLITGIKRQDSGDILFDGNNINGLSITKRGKNIGYVMQNPNHMITRAMIMDEVSLGLKLRGEKEEIIKEKAIEALKTCGLYEYRNWPITALSYGQKKRLTIASILALDPKVLILDEPTAGQDYKHYTEFMDFIKELAKKGLGIILITHDMHLALEYTERAIVLSDGLKIADDKVFNIFTDKEVIKKANLQETSLSMLASSLEIDDKNNFIRCFIENEKKVKF